MDKEQLRRHPSILRMYTSRVDLKRQHDGCHLGRCPFEGHADNNPSFNAYYKDGMWRWRCFSEDLEGDIFEFLQKVEEVSFLDAVKMVKEFVEESWEGKKEKVDAIFKPAVPSVTAQTKSFSLEQYKPHEDELWARPDVLKWLEKERGIKPETAKKLHFGFRQDASAFAGKPNTDIATSGWISFPYIEHNRVVAIKYRSIVRKAFCQLPGMKIGLFNTSTVDVFEPVYLVEGEFDAAVMEQSGFKSVSLPSASTRLTAEMKDVLLKADKIILAGDCDSGVGAEVMDTLFREMPERTFLLHWPEGCKDANDTYKANLTTFVSVVEQLTIEALATPMPNFVSVQEVMLAADKVSLLDDPRRFRFPWPEVDNMAIILPGSVTTFFATQTGQGKTTFLMNATVEAAIKQHETIVNYQCELSPDELATAIAAYLTMSDRNHLTDNDWKNAAAKMGGAKYYIGRDDSISTIKPALDLIEAAIQRLSATVVVLDHIHFLSRNEEDAVGALADAMQRIKRMAQKYGVKFIVVAQPRKASAKDRGKIVHITDVKGSETVTSDADVVFALHRNYSRRSDPDNPAKNEYDPKTTIALLKARAKGEGMATARLIFNGAYARFAELVKSTVPEGVL